MWRRFICWLLGAHDPVSCPRQRPLRSILVCRRCNVDLDEDPWKRDGDGPRRMA
jgi:hypothetical protein